jgi:hypothetical protein
VCFSTLPLRFRDAAAAAADVPKGDKLVYLHGSGQRRMVFKRVVAWRLELDGDQPKFFMLPSTNRGWLRLAKASYV